MHVGVGAAAGSENAEPRGGQRRLSGTDASGAEPQFFSLPEPTPTAGDVCNICMAPGPNKPKSCSRVLCAKPEPGAEPAIFAVPSGASKTRDFCLKFGGKACIPLVNSFPRKSPLDPHGPGPDPGPWDKKAYRTSLDVFRMSAEDLHKAGELSATDFSAAMKAYKADSQALRR